MSAWISLAMCQRRANAMVATGDAGVLHRLANDRTAEATAQASVSQEGV